MSKIQVAVLGASGFAGAELLRRLLRHPGVEVARVCAADHVGEPLSAAHPHLEGLTELRFENLPAAAAVRGMDAVLMGLPHTASAEVIDAVGSSPTRIIDMSGAFRLASAVAYARYYGAAHPRPDLLGQFVYGLPELNRASLKGASRVAAPGCFATCIELALLPFAREGLLGGPVQVVGVTGSSGSGAQPSPTTHHPVRAHNLRTYRPLKHQHSPEILATLTAAGARNLELAFVPVSAPLVRGIFATCFFRLSAEVAPEAVLELQGRSYAGERFVVVPRARLPEVVGILGSNRAEVGVELGPQEGATRTVSAFATLDNLVKGGAGQVVQCLNLMFGFEEGLLLDEPGLYP